MADTGRFSPGHHGAGEPHPAVVLGAGPAGLAVVRSLGGRGIPVTVLDRGMSGPAQVSRYAMGAGTVPDPLQDEEGFIGRLLAVGESLPRPGVLFPCSDEWVLTVTRHRARLASCYLLPTADYPVVSTLLNKALLYQAAARVGIPVPTYYDLRSEEPERIAARLTYPCIVRPAVKRDFPDRFGTSVVEARNGEELLALVRRAPDLHLLAQVRVAAAPNSLYTFACYMDGTQRVRGAFVGLRLATYPAGTGTSCLVEPAVEPEVQELGIRLLGHLGYRGIAEVEFIRDPADGRFKLLDVNPRPWKWIGLPIAAGVDLPWLAYCDAVGQAEHGEPRRHRLRWVSMLDYISLQAAGDSLPPGSHLTDREWMSLFTAAQPEDAPLLVDAVYRHDDPMPFVTLLHAQAKAGHRFACAC